MKLNNKKEFYFGSRDFQEQEKHLYQIKFIVQLKKYGKTLYVNGDEMRKILDLKSYKNSDRKKGAINI